MSQARGKAALIHQEENIERGIKADCFLWGLPGGSDGKESACNVGDLCSIPGLGRSSGEGNGNPLQYSCLENPWTEEPGRLQSMGLQRVRHD